MLHSDRLGLQALLGVVQQAAPCTRCANLTYFIGGAVTIETDGIGKSSKQRIALAAHASHRLAVRQDLAQNESLESTVRAEPSSTFGQVCRAVANGDNGSIPLPSGARGHGEGVDQIAQRTEGRRVVHYANEELRNVILVRPLLLLPEFEEHKVQEARVVHGVVERSGVRSDPPQQLQNIRIVAD